jgi:hypothetical protein
VSRWEYEIKGYSGPQHPAVLARRMLIGDLILDTYHLGEHSRDIEVAVWRDRLERGEASRIEVISLIEPYGMETIT